MANAGPAAGGDDAPPSDASTMLKFRVTHAKTVHMIEVPSTMTVAELQQHLADVSDVPIENQKLMFKGGMKDKDKTLEEIGVKSGIKIMMVGNKAENIKKLRVAPPPDNEGTNAETASKTPLCQETKHKKVIDRGLPADAEKGIEGTHSDLPESLAGMVNVQNQKIRLTFKPGDGQVSFCTPERTQKYPLGQFPEVTDDPIDGHPGYRIVGVRLGKTAASMLYLYWVPQQYVRALRMALTGVADTSTNVQAIEDQMMAEAIRKSMMDR